MNRTISVAFLLGAGVSLPRAPTTKDLTQCIVERSNEYFLHTDEDWYPGQIAAAGVSSERRKRAARVRRLIGELRQVVERYYGAREEPAGCVVRQCSYEDIAYLADSLANTLSRERDDPGLIPLVEKLKTRFRWSSETLRQAADDTVRLVRAVVYHKLAPIHPSPGHILVVRDAGQDSDVLQFPIYTLNHDCLIEETLRAATIPTYDFLRPDHSRRLVLGVDDAIPNDARVVLYKLHGSVNWRRFRPLSHSNDSDPWFEEWVGQDCDVAGTRHDEGNEWRSVGGPLILVGRFNKELNYLDAPFWHLFSAFERSLMAQRNILVSGYSFGDKAINSMLINWIYARPHGERRIIVMHSDEDQLVDGARGAIRSKWNDWKAQSLLRIIPCFLSDCRWTDVKQEL